MNIEAIALALALSSVMGVIIYTSYEFLKE